MKEKKPSWLINYGAGLALLFILLASIINALFIYVVMAFVGAIAVVNMVNIEKMKLKKPIETEPEEEIEETPPEPPKEYNEKLLKKARKFLEKGYTIEEIREGLSEKYIDSVVDLVIKELEV